MRVPDNEEERVDRRSFLLDVSAAGAAGLAGLSGLAGLAGLSRGVPGWRRLFPGLRAAAPRKASPRQEIPKLQKPKEEWRRLLQPDRYRVLFEEATERPFTSPLNEEHRDGTFVCAACFLPLFSSATKYDSGTGWPSFWKPLEGRVGTKRDFKLVLPRTEYHCIRCGGHQGHRFRDGPPPTGLRYCNNGLALRFVPEGEPLPELRT